MVSKMKKTNEFKIPKENKSIESYSIPNNWIWTEVGSIAKLLRGVTYTKGDVRYESSSNTCLILRGGNIQNGQIINNDDDVFVDSSFVKTEQRIMKDDVIIVTSTGSIKLIGKAATVDSSNKNVSFGAFLGLVRCSNVFNQRYFSYFFQSEQYRNLIRSLSAGVNINNIKKNHIEEAPFPLPPLAEQQRIVNRIESLFEKIDKAHELIEEAREGFEKRKEVILAKAFRGELTAKWREENGKTISEWSNYTVTELCSKIVDCPHSTPKWTDTGKMCLRTTNIKKGYLDLENVSYVSEESYADRTKRLKPKPGDILFTREGNIGDIGIIPDSIELCMGQRMLLLRVHEYIQPEFLLFFFQTPDAIKAMHHGTGGTTSQHINVRDIKKITVPVPSLVEMKIITRILGHLLSDIDKVNLLTDLKQSVEYLKKSILAKAFRGELGTNDPYEESAINLLNEILAKRIK